MFKMSFEREVPCLLHRLLHRLGAEYPFDVLREAMVFRRLAPQIRHAPDRPVRNACREPMLITPGARCVIASEARAAHGNPCCINIGARNQLVDTSADRDLISKPMP